MWLTSEKYMLLVDIWFDLALLYSTNGLNFAVFTYSQRITGAWLYLVNLQGRLKFNLQVTLIFLH
ncbi:MAG: hypothetical protein DCF20_05735 [Pseudanabaena sp.]|nr:MAG: hypothetical protein DCF20_05735 [Pseudanabaena sp.]